METGKDIIVALSSTFIWWTLAITYAGSRLVWGNWSIFRRWRLQDREMLGNLALWASLPGFALILAWMRGIAQWHYSAVYGIPLLSMVQMFVYLPFALLFLDGFLFYTCDRAYRFREQDGSWNYSAATRVWCRLNYTGIGAAALTFIIERI